VLVVTVAVVAGLSQLIAKDPGDPGGATATAAPTPCVKAADPYGTAPDGYTYEPVDEATRAKTVEALKLDEAGGRVDMRAARRDGQALGTLVGIPSRDPAGYVRELVKTAQTGGSPVTKKGRYAVIPFAGGAVVAVGARGCQAILVNASDPKVVPLLADAVFARPAG
jgi:hypothetical protein